MIYGNSQSQKILIELLNRENGVILLIGPEGVGKFSFIQEFLKDKNWEKVIVNSNEDFLKIETARKIVSLANKKSEKRIIVINDFHKFLPFTQNTFLKTLEDSLSKSIFVLISHKEEKILPTIRSRSLKVKFSLVDKEQTQKALMERKFGDKEIKLALEIYPFQPGKAINFLENKKLFKIFQNFILTKNETLPFDELEKIFEQKETLDLKSFLEPYLLYLLKQTKNQPEKWLSSKNLNYLKEVLNLYYDADYNLNFEIQLTNLVLNYG